MATRSGEGGGGGAPGHDKGMGLFVRTGVHNQGRQNCTYDDGTRQWSPRPTRGWCRVGGYGRCKCGVRDHDGPSSGMHGKHIGYEDRSVQYSRGRRRSNGNRNTHGGHGRKGKSQKHGSNIGRKVDGGIVRVSGEQTYENTAEECEHTVPVCGYHGGGGGTSDDKGLQNTVGK